MWTQIAARVFYIQKAFYATSMDKGTFKDPLYLLGVFHGLKTFVVYRYLWKRIC